MNTIFCMYDKVSYHKGSLVFKVMPSFSICTHHIASKAAKTIDCKTCY